MKKASKRGRKYWREFVEATLFRAKGNHEMEGRMLEVLKNMFK